MNEEQEKGIKNIISETKFLLNDYKARLEGIEHDVIVHKQKISMLEAKLVALYEGLKSE